MPAFPPFTSRSFQGRHDLDAILDLLVVARAQTSDWRYPHLGEFLFEYFMIACHLDPHTHIRLWHDQTGQLVAYALLGEDPTFDCRFLPAYTGMGIEDQALTWAASRLLQLRRQDPETWGGSLLTGVRKDDHDRLVMLGKQGFQTGTYTEVNMLRSLADPIPDLPLPPGWQVRALSEHEIALRAAAHREVWHPWTVGNVSDANYAAFMQLPGYHQDLDIVAVHHDGALAAYVNGWIDPINCIGDFGPVGALPAYRRRGLTRLVLLEALRRMKAAGMHRVCVSTGIENIAARSLYQSVGFREVNFYHQFVKPGTKLQ